jgi:hypothetical protein
MFIAFIKSIKILFNRFDGFMAQPVPKSSAYSHLLLALYYDFESA